MAGEWVSWYRAGRRAVARWRGGAVAQWRSGAGPSAMGRSGGRSDGAECPGLFRLPLVMLPCETTLLLPCSVPLACAGLPAEVLPSSPLGRGAGLAAALARPWLKAHSLPAPAPRPGTAAAQKETSSTESHRPPSNPTHSSPHLKPPLAHHHLTPTHQTQPTNMARQSRSRPAARPSAPAAPAGSRGAHTQSVRLPRCSSERGPIRPVQSRLTPLPLAGLRLPRTRPSTRPRRLSRTSPSSRDLVCSPR